jgi:phosphoribosylformylglycinamidine (FGAM) synthase PurS component
MMPRVLGADLTLKRKICDPHGRTMNKKAKTLRQKAAGS